MRALKDLFVRLRRSWRVLLKELSAFGIVGMVCLGIELGLFQVLYAYLGAGAVTSKLIPAVIALTIAYFGHRHWSFAHRARTGLRREYTIFFGVNGVALALGLAIMAFVRYVLGQDDAIVLQLTNIGSIALGTLIRFACYRKWVFVSANSQVAIAHREQQERRAKSRQVERAAA